jgi:hypothetical protein
MFVTKAEFEHPMPLGLIGPGEKAWQAMSMSLRSPWFLFDYVVKYSDAEVVQTTAVAWELTLLDVLRAVPANAHRGVSRVSPSSGSRHDWSVQVIRDAWVSLPDESTDVGPLVFRLREEDCLRDSFMKPVPWRNAREQLLSLS